MVAFDTFVQSYDTTFAHTNSHFSVLFSSMQKDDVMSKRNAELIAESAAAKQRLVRNLSAFVKVEKDNKADYVVGVEHPSHTIKAGNNHQRQQSELASSAASMDESTLVNIAGVEPRATAKQASSATHKRGVHNVRSHDDLPAHE